MEATPRVAYIKKFKKRVDLVFGNGNLILTVATPSSLVNMTDFIGIALAPLAYRGANVAGKKTSLNASCR